MKTRFQHRGWTQYFGFVGVMAAVAVSFHPSHTPAEEKSARTLNEVSARVSADADVDPEEFFKQGQFAESTKDWSQAMKLYRKGATRGHAPSQNNLGFLLLRGLGGDRNAEEAVKWFREAARQGHSAAQNNLGVCFRDGQGVKEDQAAAAKWRDRNFAARWGASLGLQLA